MGQDSNIEWTTHTFNPWRGCTKVSDGCKFCYADKLSSRNPKALGVWGPNGTRVVAAEAYWKQPIKWDKAAEDAGERHRVFCASLADVFEGEDTMPEQSHAAVHNARARLWTLIHGTKHLDWILLTKRPENIIPIIGGTSGAGMDFFENEMRNVWVGTSIENQQAADERIPHLIEVPATVKFLSCEPLLGSVILPESFLLPDFADDDPRHTKRWVIAGCESSGKKSGRFADGYEGAARSLMLQCQSAEVPFFHKQMPIGGHVSHDMANWPADLRIRQFPAPTPKGE